MTRPELSFSRRETGRRWKKQLAAQQNAAQQPALTGLEAAQFSTQEFELWNLTFDELPHVNPFAFFEIFKLGLHKPK